MYYHFNWGVSGVSETKRKAYGTNLTNHITTLIYDKYFTITPIIKQKIKAS